MKVYEWGPEKGQKVLFVHGITTTCISLGAVAQGLADRGYRVMLFVSPVSSYLDTGSMSIPFSASSSQLANRLQTSGTTHFLYDFLHLEL